MSLVATEMDPVPPGSHVDHLTTPDAVELRAARWSGCEERGTIVFLSGRTEYIEKYFDVYARFLDQGFAVATLDWRGQGLSERPLANRQAGHVESFDRYVSDLDHFMEAFVAPSCPPPYQLVAHSMGGHIALRYLHDQPSRFARAAFSAPMWGIRPWREHRSWPDILGYVTSALGLSERYMPGLSGDFDRAAATFEANVLTSDRGRFDRMMAQIDAEPALALGAPTLGWIHEALRSIHTTRLAGFAESITTPIRVFSAGGDRVVPIAAHHYFAGRLPSAEIITVDQAQHELFIESDTYRDPVLESLDEFIGEEDAAC